MLATRTSLQNNKTNMKRSLLVPALAALVASSSTAGLVDSFGSGANAFTMNFVSIGNPNNLADTAGAPDKFGAVAYSYRMGTYEVSEDMINKANTAGVLGITKVTLGTNKPATSISWDEAARFVNWLNVSSGSVAAYKFSAQPGGAGYSANANAVLWSVNDSGYNAADPIRNSNAKYFLPNGNEWYKAAYYDPNKPGGAGYWDYASGSDTAPTAVASGTSGAVYNQAGPADITSAGGLSPYGTMGQGGNAFELTETSGVNGVNLFGGYWQMSASALSSAHTYSIGTDAENPLIGFRVASSEMSAVPEVTSSFTLFGLMTSGLLLRRRTKHLR